MHEKPKKTFNALFLLANVDYDDDDDKDRWKLQNDDDEEKKIESEFDKKNRAAHREEEKPLAHDVFPFISRAKCEFLCVSVCTL